MFDTRQDAYGSLRGIVAERTNRLVFWVGAGLSRSSGIPSWIHLRTRLCEVLETKAGSLEDEEEAGRLRARQKQAKEQANLWVAFEILREALGEASYRATVSEALACADTAEIPPVYEDLWHLPIQGILTCNLDRLVVRAHAKVTSAGPLNTFVGRDSARYVHLLRYPHPFVAQLHGVTSDFGSWVFTQTELRRLLQDAGYRKLVESCITTATIVLVGITADDVAIAEHFRFLREQGIDFGSHYWITSRSDGATDKWAEGSGIRVIRYKAAADDHSELRQLFADLVCYVPREPVPPPVLPTHAVIGVSPLPSPRELVVQPPETIRQKLNARAREILDPDTKEARRAYEKFVEDYDEAIDRAFYLPSKIEGTTLFGYRLEEELSPGAFARVFRATAASGDTVAVKLLREDIRRNPDKLQSFRRGVEAMNILARRRVQGIVPYLDKSELPPAVIMEFVEGPNLEEVVKSRLVPDWSTVLHIAVELAHIIRSAHLQPERVLHRDIRPPNIMLKHFYSAPDDWTVVVLDFDLCWYMGAAGVSVISAETTTGFLSPEQLHSTHTASTRNALVDSYGLGMTLFFLRTGSTPVHGQPEHANWHRTLQEAMGRHPCSDWHSTPRRFARLIELSTKPKQSERWDMSMMEAELERLQSAVARPDTIWSAELWAEEVAARGAEAVGYSLEYGWDADTEAATIELIRGLRLLLAADEQRRTVRVSIDWSSTGDADFRHVAKFLPAKCDKAASLLRRGGWKERDRLAMRGQTAHCELEIPVQSLQTDIEKATKALGNAVNVLKLD